MATDEEIFNEKHRNVEWKNLSKAIKELMEACRKDGETEGYKKGICGFDGCKEIGYKCLKHHNEEIGDFLERGRKEGAQEEREKWKYAICATDTIDAPEGGVIGIKAYWISVEKLKEQGIVC